MQRIQTQLLACAGRLLLEYNESTGEIHRALQATAHAISKEKCAIEVTYGAVSVSLGGGVPIVMPVRALRYNAALQVKVATILRQLRQGDFDSATALSRLERAEAETPFHPRWLSVLLLGVAASSLAVLLGADASASAVAGLATGVGLVVRQEFGRWSVSVLMPPFAAGLVGAVLGSLAIRLGWTRTPGLVLVVPSLMLIPGPHLINGLLDIVDNFISLGIARLTLACTILVATALGIVLGMELSLRDLPRSEHYVSEGHLNLITDVLLAGIVTIGFAVYYNTALGHVMMAAAGGMAGHGLRFLLMRTGWGLVEATLAGSLAVGIIASLAGRSCKAPFAVMAFAGAVTMMPGLQMFRAMSGSWKLARLVDSADLPTVAGTVGFAFQASGVVMAIALGLLIASRTVRQIPIHQGENIS